MKHNYDIIIIGGGIAGVSAALTCVNRGKNIALITNPAETQSLYKAERIMNYPGFEGISGKEFAERLHVQLEKSGAEMIGGRALSITELGGSFGVAVGNEFCSAKAVILALGITREKLYPGEAEFLGRGVSYCATCDAMLYRNKTVALIGNNREAYSDADLLRGICGDVLHFTGNSGFEISGNLKADTLSVNGEKYPVDGVFIIKDTVSVSKLISGLEYSDGCITVDKSMRTSIDGVFAAGDCTGRPYQLAKAAGEGNIAALSACKYIDSIKGE